MSARSEINIDDDEGFLKYLIMGALVVVAVGRAHAFWRTHHRPYTVPIDPPGRPQVLGNGRA